MSDRWHQDEGQDERERTAGLEIGRATEGAGAAALRARVQWPRLRLVSSGRPMLPEAWELRGLPPAA
jgi:hypothetical protein